VLSRLLALTFLLPFLGACNMIYSESPMFADADKAVIAPRDGIWLNEDPDCPFDSSLPESRWPSCAAWMIVRASSGQLVIHDAKSQSDGGSFLIVTGAPPIVQVRWHDEAKEDGKTFYVFFGMEPGPPETDGRFAAASTWEVQCGVKSGSEIAPYPGIGAECRPLSKDAIRSAALASRSSAEMAMSWRWLRPESR
jgi:hypothetical protein